MKKARNLLSVLISTIFVVIMIFACTRDSLVNENKSLETKDGKSNMMARYNSANDTLSINIEDGNYKINLTGSIYENDVISNFQVIYGGNIVFDIPYEFNVNDTHWRLQQHPKIILKAKNLANVSPQIIIDVQSILDKSVDYIYSETLEVKNTQLVSLVNYYNSILNTRIRANNENSDCDCKVNPEFILNKTFFNCQEDQFYEVSQLKQIISDYSTNNQLDSSTTALKSFLNNTSLQKINYETYYSFYVTPDNFDTFVNNVAQTNGDCSSWCPLGCGSDHGCCGNYSGCCLYWDIHCYIHDKLCVNCTPSWFCLPGCKPDKPKKQVASLSIY